MRQMQARVNGRLQIRTDEKSSVYGLILNFGGRVRTPVNEVLAEGEELGSNILHLPPRSTALAAR